MNQEAIDANLDFYARNPRLVQELRRSGIEPLGDVHPQSLRGGPQDSGLVQALLASLDHAPNIDELQSYIGLLSRTKTPYDAQPLIDIYNATDVYRIKSTIMRVMAYSGAQRAQEWFTKILLDPTQGEFRELAAGYCSELKTGKQFLPLLREHFAEFPVNATETFWKFGGEEELELLKQHRYDTFNVAPEDHKNLLIFREKTIAKLEKKVARQHARRSKAF